MYTNVKLWRDEEGYLVVPIPDEYPLDEGAEVVVNRDGDGLSLVPVDNIVPAFDAAAELLGKDFMIDEYPEEEEHGV